MFKVTHDAITTAGGTEIWDSLSDMERKRHHAEMYDKLVREIGQEEFNKLSLEEKEGADLLLWAGCCMHKDMNAFKGRVTTMEQFWQENQIPGPIKMYNRDNAATADLAPGTGAAKHAEEKSKGGAVKAASLAGAVFHHKDRKWGQQDTLHFFFNEELGFTICFPDTNNTCFQLHAEACSVIITYLDLLLKFLQYVKDNKVSRSLNHMENNVNEALNCDKTRHKFCVVTIYHQAFSVPYMRKIWGPLRSEDNVLKLAGLHKRIETHLCKFIMKPELLIGPTAMYQTGSLDGKQWDRPDAMYAIQRYAPDLLYLKPLLTQFCVGALEMWWRFSAEFADDGAIAKASEESIERAWMESTNDANESAFGILHRTTHANPSISLPQLNARQMYKQNGTSGYQSALNPAQRKAIRKITHRQDESGMNRQERLKQVRHLKKVGNNKRKKDEAHQERQRQAKEAVANVAVILDVSQLDCQYQLLPQNEGYLSVAALDLQLDWHLQYDSENAIPKAKTQRGTRDSKYHHLRAAVLQYNESSMLHDIATTSQETQLADISGLDIVESRGEKVVNEDIDSDSEDEYYNS